MSELNIPESWAEITSLNASDDITDYVANGSFKSLRENTKILDDEDFAFYVRLSDLRKGLGHNRQKYVDKKTFEWLSKSYLNGGELLIANVGANFGETIVMPELEKPCTVAPNMLVMRVSQSLNNKFIYHFLKSPKGFELFNSMVSTTAQPKFNKTEFRKKELPLPPLGEQERIVKKIETCFEKIDETESSLSKVEKLLEKYRESLLAKAFRGELIPQNPDDEPASALLSKIRAEREKAETSKKKKVQAFAPITDDEKPFDIPESWELVRLSELLEIINGRAYKQKELLDEGVPVLRVGNLFTSNKWYYSDLNLDPDKYIQKGDFIFAWSASFGPFIWKGDKVIYHYHIWKFKLHLSDEVLKEYLYFYLLAESERIKKSSKGIAMAHLTKAGMESFLVPLPPRAEQQKIVNNLKNFFHKYEDIKSEIIANRKKSSLLKNSVLVKAFEGRLVEQIESEGTGQELLEKILEAKVEEAPKKKVTKKKVAKKASKKITTKKK